MSEIPCPFCQCTAKRYDLGIDSYRCVGCGYTDYAAPQGRPEPPNYAAEADKLKAILRKCQQVAASGESDIRALPWDEIDEAVKRTG